jgi:anti-sigma B factor antagonist/stage II sporulation protein AA (anti-sigma F factor antagonist)
MSASDKLANVKEEQRGDLIILRLKGRLDAISSPGIEKQVFENINNGWHNMLFDFSEVDYLSSAGMRMLLSTTRKLKTLSGKLIVSNVNVNVMDVLKMSGFDHVLEIAQNEEEALTKF